MRAPRWPDTPTSHVLARLSASTASSSAQTAGLRALTEQGSFLASANLSLLLTYLMYRGLLYRETSHMDEYGNDDIVGYARQTTLKNHVSLNRDRVDEDNKLGAGDTPTGVPSTF